MIVGIDIGTSYSSISILGHDTMPQPVKVSNGACIFGDSYSMPSAAYVNEDGTILIGQLAISAKMKNPSRYKGEFKRDLGQKVPYNLGQLQLLPEDLYKEIFIYFKACAEEFAGEKIDKAYITYPANFHKRKRDLVEHAAMLAGLLDIELVDEPTAAALCYCSKGKIKEGDKLLVYDFGGGTFDVALIEYVDNNFIPLTQSLGIDKCGGVDIDRIIFEDIMSTFLPDVLQPMENNKLAKERFNAQIMELSIRIKHQLSSVENFKDGISIFLDYVDYELSREKLNKLIMPLIDETLVKVRDIIKNAGLTMENIDTCVLVGGTCRIPCIKSSIEKLIGKPVYKDIDPELAVCMGAALWKQEKEIDLETAIKYYDSGKYDKVTKVFEEAALKDNVKAQYYFGACFDYGRGVEKNKQEAIKWYKKAADQGYSKAQNSLGVCYSKGSGVEKDDTKAFMWFCEAAGQGDQFSQYNLGLYYELGKGVQKDMKNAISWYEIAAKQEYVTALNRLGEIYEEGRGVDKNEQKAIHWYRKAGIRGNVPAIQRVEKFLTDMEPILPKYMEINKLNNINSDRINNIPIGIALGTTEACIAIMQAGKPYIIPNRFGERTTPTVIAFDESGKVIVGKAAMKYTNSIYLIMKSLNQDKEFFINNKKYMIEEILSMMFQQLKDDTEHYMGEKIHNAVVSIPSYYGNTEKEVIIKAMERIGIIVRRFITNTAAISLYYGFRDCSIQIIMICDLGGSNYEVSIADIGDGVVEIVSTIGDPHIGGDDFNDRIMKYILQQIKTEKEIDLSMDPMALFRLREAVEIAKNELSEATSTVINIPFITYDSNGPTHLNINLERSQFNDLTADLIEKIKAATEKALYNSYLEINDKDKVILVGEATRIPAVQDCIRKLNGITSFARNIPEGCAALGAAIQGGKLVGDFNTYDILLLNRITQAFGIEKYDGTNIVLIDRGTFVPIYKSLILTTIEDGQTAIDIHIVEGDNEYAKDNKTLATFRLEGIAPVRKGITQLEIGCDVDANNTINITIKDLGADKKCSIPLVISKDIKDFGKYKIVRFNEEEDIEHAIKLYNDKMYEDAYRAFYSIRENRIAQYYLGICYEKGNYVHENKKEAMIWFKRAASQGHEDAVQKLNGF